MREYEVVYIFRSTLEQESVEEKLESHHRRITGDGEITAVEHWGKRQLAYPIQKQENGYYVVAQFRADPSVLEEFERALKMDEDLLRHLVVLSEGELPTPPSARRRKSGDDGEDEEGEDEGDEEDEEEDDGEDEDDEEEEDEEDEDGEEDDEGDDEEDEEDEEDEDEEDDGGEDDEEDEEDEDDEGKEG